MKTLTITDTQQLSEIKENFNTFFPHLKIEFFSETHPKGEASPLKKKYDDKLFLKDIRTKNTSSSMISVDGHQKTFSFEANFLEQFGISIQVLRKSGNIWLQTTATDDWTLSHQEEEGIEFDS